MISEYKPLTPRQFEALSKPQRRVAVAEDVLKQIEAAKYVASKGIYVQSPKHIKFSRHNLIGKDAPKCQVCAYGAAVLSIIRLDNKFSLSRPMCGIPNEGLEQLAKRVFPQEQIHRMEAYFEGWEKNHMEDDEKDRINFFYGQYGQEDRLVRIFSNVIRNKGKFIPERGI